ncbi:hypothetical protein ACFLXC_03200 [Chloroflexota bacterium]
MIGMDWKQLGAMLGPAVQQQLSQLTPQARQALRETEAYITHRGSFIGIDLRFREENPEAEKARDTLTVSLLDAIPQVVKMLGCRAFIKVVKEEERGPDEQGNGTADGEEDVGQGDGETA